jgi:hypothetical protein
MQCDRGSSIAPATFIGAMDDPPDLGIGWRHHGLHRTGAIKHCDSGRIDDAAFVGGSGEAFSRIALSPPPNPPTRGGESLPVFPASYAAGST